MAFTQMRALSRVCLCLTFSEAFGAHSLKLQFVGGGRWWTSPASHCHQCCHGVDGVGGGMNGVLSSVIGAEINQLHVRMMTRLEH